jgi:hypothetical protein
VYENVNALIRSKYVIPSAVLGIEDSEVKYLMILRLALVQPDITYVQTANTSTFTVLANLLNDHWDLLVDSVEHGGFHRWNELSPGVQQRLVSRLEPQSGRASELRALSAIRSRNTTTEQKRLRLSDIFPQVQAVGCWKSGSAGIFLKRLYDEFPDTVQIRDVGYIASEMHGTTPLDGDGTAALPTYDRVYFEFVPRATWDGTPRHAVETLGLHELELGEQYYVIVTTSDGLLRYDMNDILEVVGYFGDLPRLQFVQKGSGVTNITGEKVSEYQVVRGVNRLESEQHIRAVFFLMLADENEGRYHLYYQPTEEYRCQVEHFLRGYAGEMDRFLCDLNIEYADKRKSGRLKPLKISALNANAFKAFRSDWIAGGRREAQFKIVALQHRWENTFPFEQYVSRRFSGSGPRRASIVQSGSVG